MSVFFSDNEAWVKAQCQDSNLGDVRRNKRALKLAMSILNNPAASLPLQTETWYELKAGYRFLNGKPVTHKALQEDHYDNVMKATEKSTKTVLFIQDKSEIDFSSKKAAKGLGPIGNHKGQGIMLQSVLAVEFDKNPISVLGLAHQKAWIRTELSYRKKEARSERYKRPTEADYWIETLENIKKPNEVETQCVTVGDRENDIYKFISYCKKSGWNYLIRANNARIITTESGERIKLVDWARSLPEQVKKEIDLRARPGKSARKATLSIGWGTIFITTPKNGFKKSEHETIKVSCRRVWEEGSAELEWLLVTNLEVTSKEDALEKVGWYEARWLIEEYHKCLKTGCAMEKRQLRSSEGLLAMLGFLGVIATRLLAIKFFARQNSSEKAKDHFPILGVQLLCSRYNLSVDDMTCHQFWRSLARLGGFIGRKSDGNPGWQTTWKGWVRFLDMISAIETIKNYEPDEPQDEISSYHTLWHGWISILDKFIGIMRLEKCG